MASTSKSKGVFSKAQIHIEEIRRKKFSIGAGAEPNPLTEDLHHAVRNLSLELYTKDVHFLMELIQNAEDNEYPDGVEPTLEFVITSEDITKTGAPATLLVLNNEIGFSKSNMESICSVGKSTKRGRRSQGFVGEKGIGFKSVFLISKHPHIFSNDYRVKFSDEPTEDSGIGYIVPEWAKDPTLEDVKRVYGCNKNLPRTVIILPLRSDKVKDVKKKLSEVHPELLLFLSKIKHITVSETVDGSKSEDILTSISVSSRIQPMSRKGGDATTFFVNLSAEEKTKMTCKYYIWKQEFPVKPENKVDGRKDVDKWVISLAFPLGERVTRGAPRAGIFAFLPTEMITSFRFIIQADFILASSRETILVDNKWNLGILRHVPSMFVDALLSYIKSPNQPLANVVRILWQIPRKPSSFPVLNSTIRDIVRAALQKIPILPCEPFSNKEINFCKPPMAVRILADFRKILMKAKNEGLSLENVSTQEFSVLHHSIDDQKHDEVLNFLEVKSSTYSVDWYMKCIDRCDLVMGVSEDTYLDLLWFVKTAKPFKIPLQGFLRRLGSDINKKDIPAFVYYTESEQLHAWLNKWNSAIGSGLVFVANSLHKSIANHVKGTELVFWLCSKKHVVKTSCSDYMEAMLKINLEMEQVVSLAHFLYHSFEKELLSEFPPRHLPIVDSHGNVHSNWSEALVPQYGSDWILLFDYNPFERYKYVEIGQVYAEEREIAGEYSPKNSVLEFLTDYTDALDIPYMYPPDVSLLLASKNLTSKKAFLLLDWLRDLSTDYLPTATKFIESIKNGKWMKATTGFASPNQCVLSDRNWQSSLFELTDTLKNFLVIDEDYYDNRIGEYKDVLEIIGVKFISEDSCKTINDHFRVLASSEMKKDDVYSLLKYVKHAKENGKIDESFLTALGQKEWLKTSQGYKSPRVSVYVTSDMDAILKITNIPLVDKIFYGNEISEHVSELKLVGVMVELEDVSKYMLESFVFPADLAEMGRDEVLLLLRAIRSTESYNHGVIEKLKAVSWMRTKIGFLPPLESILWDDACWGPLSGVIEVPSVDIGFYGSDIRTFKEELKAIGVSVDFDAAQMVIVARFASVMSAASPSSDDVKSVLNCVRAIKERIPLLLEKIKISLGSLNFLKTRHAYKSPSESILNDPNWFRISQFADLPIIDDGFYRFQIYSYKNELKLLGVITNSSEGSYFIAAGLHLPANPGNVKARTAMMFLDCIRDLLKKSVDNSLLQPFLSSLKNSKWLKTVKGYKYPKNCILFDPSWELTLKLTDAPFLDVEFYKRKINLHREQLKAIGVKIDAEDVCTVIYHRLTLHDNLQVVTRMYTFLDKCHWKPPSEDTSNYDIWIPGKWVKSRFCILHDKNKLFHHDGCELHVLDKYYSEALLHFFALAFGVPEFPSVSDYITLWSLWESEDRRELTQDECFFFWEYIVANWEANVNVLKDKFLKLPAVSSPGSKIYLVAKNAVSIPDNPELRAIFTIASEEPFFVWYPCEIVPSIPPLKLSYIYDCLGVKKLSDLVKLQRASVSPPDKLKKSNLKDELIVEGLVRTVLGFLSSRAKMPLQERHERVKQLLSISVHETEQPITVSYALHFPSEKERLRAETSRVVFWEKSSHNLFVHIASCKEYRTSIEFATYFAKEISCLLCRENTYLIADLSRLIQMAFPYGFTEDAVEFLLKTENMQVSVEDEELISSVFHTKKLASTSEQGPASIPSCGTKRKFLS